MLESARRRTKPRTVDLYDVFCGVLYLLKSGCQWRMLPAADWRTCYKYFRQWSERPGPQEESILEQVLKKIGWRGPTKQWTDEQPASASWTPRASRTPTVPVTRANAGKKVSGIKRHVAVDSQGLPHAHVTTADVTDRAGALAIEQSRAVSPWPGGYTGKPFAATVQNLGSLGRSGETQ